MQKDSRVSKRISAAVDHYLFIFFSVLVSGAFYFHMKKKTEPAEEYKLCNTSDILEMAKAGEGEDKRNAINELLLGH